jgi:LPS-assembly lipoprotein
MTVGPQARWRSRPPEGAPSGLGRPRAAGTRRAALAMFAVLAGCGFELRRAAALPLRSIALVGFAPDSSLRRTLADELQRAGVALQDNPARAEAVLDALTDAREKAVAASTAFGQVREVTLRVRLRFRVATPAGRQLLAPSELLLTRDMSYSETAALAKREEELLLFRAMEDDIVAQVLRRLASLNPGASA